MEILIVGGALVALMVYVSTRIKKSAAQAYERENVEKEGFVLVKPEGFIIPVIENPEYAFEARSKDYGEEEGDMFPQAEIKLKTFSGLIFDEVCQNARRSLDKVTSEKVFRNKLPEQNVFLIEGEKTENKALFYLFHKIVESEDQAKIYDLKISVLQENREQFSDRISEAISGFQVK